MNGVGKVGYVWSKCIVENSQSTNKMKKKNKVGWVGSGDTHL